MGAIDSTRQCCPLQRTSKAPAHTRLPATRESFTNTDTSFRADAITGKFESWPPAVPSTGCPPDQRASLWSESCDDSRGRGASPPSIREFNRGTVQRRAVERASEVHVSERETFSRLSSVPDPVIGAARLPQPSPCLHVSPGSLPVFEIYRYASPEEIKQHLQKNQKW